MTSTSTFVKADARNLPLVNSVMILEYMATSSNHNVVEIRGAKALMSSRDAYLNSAVGYVEIYRYNAKCTVRARVVPEHRVTTKPYTVTAKIEENDNQILDTSCEDCPAAAGGCKHSLLFLFWLEKRSSEPASTLNKCYWIKPSLSTARTNYVLAENIFKAKKIKLEPRDPNVLQDFYTECKLRNAKGSLICNLEVSLKSTSYNLFDMAVQYFQTQNNTDFATFKKHLDDKITKDLIERINQETQVQANNKYWHYLRQGRLTGSKIYEAAHCGTDGVLVQQILGGFKVPETQAIKRGTRLEEPIIQELNKKLDIKLQRTGLILIYSIVGASPDGITKDFVVEIKCPISSKTFKNYICNNEITEKFLLFCVADPDYETTKKLHLCWTQLDEVYVKEILEKSLHFWERFVYP